MNYEAYLNSLIPEEDMLFADYQTYCTDKGLPAPTNKEETMSEITQQLLKQAADAFGKEEMPKSMLTMYEVEDGQYMVEVDGVDSRVTTGGAFQAFIQFRIVSAHETGKTPQATFQIPDPQEIPGLLEKAKSTNAADQDEARRAFTGLNIFNDVCQRIGGDKARAESYSDLLTSLRNGDIDAQLKGRHAEIKTSHKGQYLQIQVIRGIGTSPAQKKPDLPTVRTPAAKRKTKLPTPRKSPKRK